MDIASLQRALLAQPGADADRTERHGVRGAPALTAASTPL